MITVIVPVYNVEKYLNRCIDSILTQTYDKFELLLINDGSKDRSGEICDEYHRKDSRIKVFHKKNGGLSSARNYGLDWMMNNSKSKWVTFVDSDDWLHPQYLETLLFGVEKYDVDICMCDAQHTNGLDYVIVEKNGDIFTYDSETTYSEYYGMAMIACAKLYNIKCFNKYRFPLDKLHEDAFLIYKLIFECEKIAICKSQLYFYYYNPCGITHSTWKKNRLDEIEAHENQLKYLKSRYINAYRTEVNSIVRVIGSQMNQILKTNSKKNLKYYLFLKIKLRKYLFLYRKLISKRIQGNEWLYERAYPISMNVYWIIIKITSKRS